ncbi:MAG: type II toxin-antitoxin system VapC family toxin, partial [Rhizobium sp.]
MCDVTIMEQAFGAERFWLRSGSLRYSRLLDEALISDFGRILSFDRHTAIETGRLRARRLSQGRLISMQDANDRRH